MNTSGYLSQPPRTLASVKLERYRALKAADDAYSAALINAYGSNYCDHRYDLDDAETPYPVRKARKAFHDARQSWEAACDALRTAERSPTP